MSEITSKTTVRTLLCHRHVDMALTCLGSLLKFSAEPLKLIIHDDGSLNTEDAEILKEHLTGSDILFRPEIDRLMDERLQNHPHARASRYKNPLRLKLLDVFLLSDEDVSFCDSDILFFRPFCNFFSFPDRETSAIFMMDRQNAYSVDFRSLERELRLPSKVNGGLFSIRKSVYDLDFVEWFLSQEKFMHVPNWATQTCLAALGNRQKCKLWSPEQIAMVQSKESITDTTVAGHFSSQVRYLLPDYTPKETGENTFSPANQPVSIEIIPTKECEPLELLYVQIRRKIRLSFLAFLYKLRSSPLAKFKRKVTEQTKPKQET